MPEKTTKQYDEFVAKFEKRQSSYDCFTPPLVYEAVVKYCERRFGIDRTKIVRPFCPGGDFENFDYPDDCYVIDNPPFSIMSRILKFFISHKIKYFLFTQSLTSFGCLRFNHTTLLYVNKAIIYDNKANVKTAFYHNLGDPDVLFETDPDFSRQLHIANDISQKKKPRPPQKIVLPDCILNTQKAPQYPRACQSLSAIATAFIAPLAAIMVFTGVGCSSQMRQQSPSAPRSTKSPRKSKKRRMQSSPKSNSHPCKRNYSKPSARKNKKG